MREANESRMWLVAIVLSVLSGVSAWIFNAGNLILLALGLNVIPTTYEWIAFTIPIYMDLSVVVGTLNLFVYRRLGMRPRLAWTGILAIAAASAGAGAAHIWGEPEFTFAVGVVVCGVLPVAVVAWDIHQVVEIGTAHQAKREQDRAAREAKRSEATTATPKRVSDGEAKQAHRSEATTPKRSGDTEAKRSEAGTPKRSGNATAPGAKGSKPGEAKQGEVAALDDREAKRNEALRLLDLGGSRNGGPSHSVIASQLGVPVSTVSRWAAAARRHQDAGNDGEETA